MMPTLYTFTHDSPMWADVTDQRALDIRDVMWTGYLATGIITFFSIFLWMINASNRKTASSVYD